jgi:spore germination cell wall hydrolase CwlJ-like protein
MGTNIFQNRLSFSVFVWLAITINIGLHYQSITKSFTYIETAMVHTVQHVSSLVDAITHTAAVVTEEVTQPEATPKIVVPTNDLQCMAENIYYESATQSYAGKIAVGQVVLNRVKDPRYPRTVCGVIYEGSQSAKTTICQFSWVCETARRGIDKSGIYWAESMKVAKELLTKKDQVDITEGALNYHAVYIEIPSWAKKLRKVVVIDQHIFYN